MGRIGSRWRVIHQTGERSDGLSFPPQSQDYFRGAFFREELPHLYACADVVICRAGANTLWEVAALAKPMLLVPLGAGSRGDQERNAQLFEQAGAAQVLRSDRTLAQDVVTALNQLFKSPNAMKDMGRNARRLIHIDSSDQIVTILGELLDSYR